MELAPRPQYADTVVIGGFWTSLQAIVNKVVSAGVTLILAYFLSPEDYGLAGIATGCLAAIAILGPASMGDVLVAHQRSLRLLASAGDRIALGVGLTMAALAIASIPFIVWLYPDVPAGRLALIIAVLALRPICEAVYAVPLAGLRSELRYRTIAAIDGTSQLVASITTVAFAAMGAGAFSLVVPQSIVLGVRGAAYRRAWRPTFVSRSSRRANRVLLRPFATAAIAQYVHNVLTVLEVLVLSLVADQHQTGIFAFAFMLASQANVMIAFQLGSVLQPIFGRIGNDRVRQAEALLRTIRCLGALLIPLSAIQAALAPTIFRTLFSARWADAESVFIALSVLQAFYFGAAPVMSFLKARSQFSTYLAWQVAQLATSAVLFAAVGRSEGAFGVAVCSAVVWALAVPTMTFLAVRGAGVVYGSVIRSFLLPWFTALPIGFGVWITMEQLPATHAALQLSTAAVLTTAALASAVLLTRWTHPRAWDDLRPIIARAFERVPYLQLSVATLRAGARILRRNLPWNS
jgi:O-antigen/teichoic acid export membrane protein